INKGAAGEGRRIDSYLQLKTTGNATVRGKIIIDSPGFDADDQRRSILRLTNHIVDLSDLVLVFFDARHPEPGAMQDTLRHLVANTVRRPDSSKFLYILNQIDTTAREDNPEEVVGAWQRAIAQAGLISGRFFCIYNPAAAVDIPNATLRQRFESKRDADLAEIHARMAEVEVQRSYRIISVIELVANEVEQELIPALTTALTRWRRLTLTWDAVAGTTLAVLLVAVAVVMGGDSVSAVAQWLADHSLEAAIGGILAFAMIISGHFSIRDATARRVASSLPERAGPFELGLRQAFVKNTAFLRSILRNEPTGCGAGSRRRLKALRNAAALHIQRLNDIYTDPSGRRYVPTPEKEKELVAQPDAASQK
ncbi:MAG: hypothetical protein HQL37_15005, partial [Alphaproteobacteria bacterium]|nr:hypothetical protein [Alphaproteobacteria bacterium]